MSIEVTRRNSALCNAESAAVPAERETTVLPADTLQSAITDRDRRPFDTQAWLDRFGAYCTPPDVLTEQRPAVEQMRTYARRARYTGKTGPVRACGVAWCHLVAIPATVAARCGEWVLERPARALVVLVTTKLLTSVPPVGWLVDHVIHPTVRYALWLFL